MPYRANKDENVTTTVRRIPQTNAARFLELYFEINIHRYALVKANFCLQITQHAFTNSHKSVIRVSITSMHVNAILRNGSTSWAMTHGE